LLKRYEALVGPPADLPSGGLARFTPGRRRVLVLRAGLLVALSGLLGGQAGAQMIVGTIRSQDTERTVAGAKVTASDSLGKQLVEVVTDQTGHFRFRLPGNVPFMIVVKKVGWRPSSTELIRGTADDTLQLDLTVPAEPTEVDAVTVTAKGGGNQNSKSLEEAKRRGWKTVMPQEVELHRDNANNFLDLMRATGAQGLMLPARPDDCVMSNRTRRCLTYVIDGVPAGTNIYVNPRDVYFYSVLSSTESAVIWGDRAPWGAIVVVTRSYGDKKNP
jgi:hypothetical protein